MLEITYDPARSLQRFIDKVKELRSPAVLPGCMRFAFLLAEKQIRKIGETFIVNPLNTSIRMAEALTMQVKRV